MPLVRISYKTPRSSDFPRNLSDCVHRAIVESLKVPDGDRFQVLTEHSEGLVYDPQFLGIERTDGIVIIQITLSSGRSVELKSALYRGIADLLESELQIRRQDIFINLIEVALENWSFGNGEAQYVLAPSPHVTHAGL